MESLSGLEEYYYYRSGLSYHSCFYVAIRLKKSPTNDELEGAIKATISKYPQLYSNAFEEHGTVTLRSLSNQITVLDVLETVDFESMSEDFNNYVFRNQNFPFGVEKPLWKILALKDRRTLVFCTDHLIADGMSTVSFWKSMMTNLNNPAHSGPLDGVVYRPSAQKFEVPQHLYDSIKYSFAGIFLCVCIRFMVLLTYLKVDLLWKVLAPELTDEDLKFKKYHFPQGLLTSAGAIRNDNLQLNLNIPSSKLKLLLKKCKSHKVSLTSLITAVIAHSLQTVPASQVEGSCIKITIPMSTRESLQKITGASPAMMEFGNFIKGGEFFRDLLKLTQLWETAASLNSELVSQKNDDDALQKIKLLSLVDVKKYVLAKVEARYPASTFEVTNLGYQSFDCGEDDKYIVEDAFFNEPQGINDVFTCSTVATPKGGLNCWFSYPKDICADFQPAIEYIQRVLYGLCE
ncbi:LAME_0D04016g1_1 [Lachancea meyersii CBS 8951]|uniref:LAME_0D04016g1_1 n=1 Tax=Lachancea meyersii CBS 8951 TaxID=1266667 RepID=A0A1G4J7W9_9SACH|nr:LAME_0D04016g1_1 [Lachancea meyersii CBS 8951]